MTPLRLLDERPGPPQLPLPEELRRLYGGGLGFDGPRVVANFVQTIDGVVALPDVPRSNALIAGGSPADRFVMGLLRACADAIVVGAGTMLGSPRGTWRADRAYPDASDAFAELRLGRSEHAEVVFVTAGRTLDPAHPVLESGAVVLTTAAGKGELRRRVPAATEVVAVNDGSLVDLRLAFGFLAERGHRLILTEGGPRLFSELLALGLVDELFLTVSPLLAGRGPEPALSLAEGSRLLPDVRVEAEVLSLRSGGEHLFLRYGISSLVTTGPTRS